MDHKERLMSQRFIVNFTSIIISIVMFSMILLNISRQTYVTALIAALAFVLTLSFYLWYLRTNNFKIWSKFFITVVGILGLIIFYTGGTEGAGVLWVFLFPFFAFQFKHYRVGLKLSLGFFITLLIVYIGILIFSDGFIMPEPFMYVYFFIVIFQISYLYFYDRDKSMIQDILEENTRKYKTLLNNLDNAVIMINREFKIIERNKVSEKWFEDSSYKDICCYEMIKRQDEVCNDCPAVIATKTKESSEIIRRIDTTKGPRDFRIKAIPLFDKDNNVTAIMETFDDVTEELIRTNHFIKEQKKLHTLSYIDGLTNIPNRRSFDAHFDTTFNQAKDTKSYVGILFIDIDYFKAFNDHYGHVMGDDTLIKVAHEIHKIVTKQEQFVARYGGEEFVVVTSSKTIEGIKQLSKHIHKSISKLKIPHTLSDIHDYVTVSIGVAYTMPSYIDTSNRLIQLADQALYQAKDKGRNTIVYKHYKSEST